MLQCQWRKQHLSGLSLWIQEGFSSASGFPKADLVDLGSSIYRASES